MPARAQLESYYWRELGESMMPPPSPFKNKQQGGWEQDCQCDTKFIGASSSQLKVISRKKTSLIFVSCTSKMYTGMWSLL